MKNLLLGLAVLFGALTLLGAGYVLFTKGQANAGYAAVPMVLSVALFAEYHRRRGE